MRLNEQREFSRNGEGVVFVAPHCPEQAPPPNPPRKGEGFARSGWLSRRGILLPLLFA